VGVVLVIELAHHLMVKASDGSAMRMFGVSFDAATVPPWLVAAALVAGGALLARAIWPLAARAWNDAMAAARSGAPP